MKNNKVAFSSFNNKLILRFDDIGASSKIYNQHGEKLFRVRNIPLFYFPLANFLFFKRIWPFAKAGPYDELTTSEWKNFLQIFKEENIRPLIAITAAWVDEKSRLIPFPSKFPEEAGILKHALEEGMIEIANHGLTHCVVNKHLPKLFSSNRKFHREFWPYLDQSIHTEHILQSQKILEDYFQTKIDTFVPPGNIWSIKTYRALQQTNIKNVLCNKYMLDSLEPMEKIKFMKDQDHCLVFHDLDLKLHGPGWLRKTIALHRNQLR